MANVAETVSLSDQQSAFDLYVYPCFSRDDRRDFAQFKQEVRVRNASSASAVFSRPFVYKEASQENADWFKS